MATGVVLPTSSGRQLKQQIGCFNCGNNNGNNNGAQVDVRQTASQTNQGGGGGGGGFPISFPISFPIPIRGHRRMLKQQVIGCVNCGSNNGNNNGAQVSVSQTATQTNGGGGGGGLPLIPFIPGIGHKRMLKQQIGCFDCGSNNGNNNGARVGVSQSTTQTSQGGGGGSNPFPISIPISIPLGGHKRMLKQCVDNFASCQSWGRTQCDRPGVADRCPCMCTGTGAPGTQPVGPPVIQQVGCFNCGNGNGNGNGK
jgi:hypothetical protein